jgi:hypothetical protein
MIPQSKAEGRTKWFVITIMAASLNCAGIMAQNMSQDAEGRTTILYNGGSIGFDIAKTNMTFTYTNPGLTPESGISGSPVFMWGFGAYGKNRDGIAGIVSRGELQPEAGIGMSTGIRHRFDVKPSRLVKLNEEAETLGSEKAKVNREIEALTGATDEKSLQDLSALVNRQNILDSRISKINEERTAINEQRVRRLGLAYLRGGINASSFRLAIDGGGNSPFSKSFAIENFTGGHIGLGVNYETGRWLLGLAWDHEFSNNLDELSYQTFTLTSTETAGNRTLTSRNEFGAWAGNYLSCRRNLLAADILLFSVLNGQERNYIAWNIYFRQRFRGTSGSAPVTVAGASAWFFNESNKLLGGIYIELSGPAGREDQATEGSVFRDLRSRVSIGLVGRINYAPLSVPGVR